MLLAFGLSLLAGLATVIGGFIGIHKTLLKCRSLAFALGFSAGAMILVSFVDLLPEGTELLSSAYGDQSGLWIGALAFVLGLLVVSLIDMHVPHSQDMCDAEEIIEGQEDRVSSHRKSKLLRSGTLVAVALAIHNFPEGIATFTGAMHEMSLGISLALAIALHNIPEGVAVAAPIFAATGSRLKALGYTLASGLAEPAGALIGFVTIFWMLPESMLGVIFCAVAGIMVYISINELMPAAKDYETERRQSIAGYIAGTALMFVSLILL